MWRQNVSGTGTLPPLKIKEDGRLFHSERGGEEYVVAYAYDSQRNGHLKKSKQKHDGQCRSGGDLSRWALKSKNSPVIISIRG